MFSRDFEQCANCLRLASSSTKREKGNLNAKTNYVNEIHRI